MQEHYLTRRKIHTHVKVLEYMGTLPAEYRKQLSKSQRFRYRTVTPENYFGHDLGKYTEETLEKFRKLNNSSFDRKVIYSYFRLACTVRNILSSAKHFHKTIIKYREIIAETILQVKEHISIERCSHFLGLSVSTLRSWIMEVRVRCSGSLINTCRKMKPNQLIPSDVGKMIKLLTNHEFRFWPLRSIYYYALNNKLVSMGESTWYKYARLLNIRRLQPFSKKQYGKSIRAIKPNQYWHADVTYYNTGDGLRHYIYTVVDNFSKFPLAIHTATRLCGEIRSQTFRQALRTALKYHHDIEIINLIVDGGPENFNGTVDEFLKQIDTIEIKRIRALKDVAFSNSMAEALNRTMKCSYLNHLESGDTNGLIKNIEFFKEDFSFKRPHGILKGLTPFEAYTGKNPKNQSFTSRIKAAGKYRVKENQKLLCSSCTFSE